MIITCSLDDLENWLRGAVLEVFSTMLKLQVVPDTFARLTPHDEDQIAGSVGFSGDVAGVIYIYSNASCARRLASAMLGLAEAEIEGHEMVNDVVGELSNMIVGAVKSRLCDRGLPCVLTIPSIVRGQQLCFEPVSTVERRVVAFRCEQDQILFEILLKPLT